MNFAVIFRYSFDDDIAVYPFEKEEDAVKFLRDNFDLEVKIDIDENGYDCEFEISDDGHRAKIINHFQDRDDITEFMIGSIYQ